MIKIFRKIHRRLQSLRSKVKEYHKRERIYHYGNENPDKIFYIICFDYETQGLFAIVKSVLSHIMYAVDKGWIPVVDLKNYSCQYQQKGENSWELFFEQPCGYTLEDISRSNRVVISYYGMYPYDTYDFYVDILDSPEKYKSIAEAYRKYIKPNAKVRNIMQETLKDLNIDNQTLGILCRGTDYINRKPHNHPRQPEPKIVIQDAKAFLAENQYSKVFVATEDQKVLDEFKKTFGNQLKYINQPRIELNSNQQFIAEINIAASDKIKMAVDYYTALFVLSRCPSILAGRTAGTLGAVLMSDGYRISKFYDLGYYD